MLSGDAKVGGAETGPIHRLDARRAYYVFLTHITKAHGAGLRWPVRTVVEFGVGTHLGIAFCALLTGARQYLGFDAVAHMDAAAQSDLLGELQALFTARAPAINDAGDKGFDFPRHILSDETLARSASWSAMLDLRRELDFLAEGDRSQRISYVAPYDAACGERFAAAADLLLSTATLEHVDDMAGGYALFQAMLKPSGFMSHSIDFKSHGFGKGHNGKRLWNEHWLLSEAEWREITKGKAYSINRIPCSDHLKLTIKAGFRLLLINKRMQENELKWSDLAPRFQWMTSDDLGCSGAHVISKK